MPLLFKKAFVLFKTDLKLLLKSLKRLNALLIIQATGKLYLIYSKQLAIIVSKIKPSFNKERNIIHLREMYSRVV